MADNTSSPNLSDRTPRRAYFTKGTQAARLFFTLLLVGGISVVIWLAARDFQALSLLKAGGVTTTAHITDKHESSGRSTTYYLNYEYLSGPETQDDQESVSWSEYSETNIGDPLTVTYLPSQPGIHRVGVVDDDRIREERIHWGWISLFTILILGGISVATEKNYRGHLALLRNGSIAPGQVTDRKIVRGKSDSYYVTYQFEANGSLQTRKISVSLRIYNSLPEGTNVTVLYDPQNPKRNYPYQALNDVALSAW